MNGRIFNQGLSYRWAFPTVAWTILGCLAMMLALAACSSEPTANPPMEAAPDTPAPVQGAASSIPAPAAAPESAPTPAQLPAPLLTSPPAPTPTPTTASTPMPLPTPTLTSTPTPVPTQTPVPTPTPLPTATNTPVPTATLVPTPTAYPTATSTPTPAVDPALAGYPPLLVEAVSSYPARFDFVSDGLSSSERKILDVADSRLFSNPNFLQSKYSPDNWPSDVKKASVQAIPLLMQEINIQKKSNGKHVITWPVVSLDRILDD